MFWQLEKPFKRFSGLKGVDMAGHAKLKNVEIRTMHFPLNSETDPILETNCAGMYSNILESKSILSADDNCPKLITYVHK